MDGKFEKILLKFKFSFVIFQLIAKNIGWKVELLSEILRIVMKLTSEHNPRRVILLMFVIKGFFLMTQLKPWSSTFVENRFQAQANRNGPFLATISTKDLNYLGRTLSRLLLEMSLLYDICWLFLYVPGTKAKLYLWQITCRLLNSLAVTSKRTLVVFGYFNSIKLWGTIL